MQIIAIFVKNLTSGGAEKQSILLAKALAKNFQIHYIIFNGDKIHQKYMYMLQEDKRIKIATFIGNHFKRYRSFLTYIKKNHIEAIFSYLTAANTYACIAGKQTGIKVYTGLRNAELPPIKCFVDKILTNTFCQKAICNCFSGANNFISKGFNKSKITVIPNCFENISPYKEKKETDLIHIITVGRFVKQKDYETAIKSIAQLIKTNANIIFEIVGYGELEMEIRNWIDKYQIKNNTHIYINPDNIPKLLEEAHIYLSTSLFEGTSNSIMEGMNANLPIVATNVGDNYKLVRHNLNGFLCEKQSEKEIAFYLEKLVSDTELRKKMGKQSKNLLEEEYSMEKFREKYIELLIRQ